MSARSPRLKSLRFLSDLPRSQRIPQLSAPPQRETRGLLRLVHVISEGPHTHPVAILQQDVTIRHGAPATTTFAIAHQAHPHDVSDSSSVPSKAADWAHFPQSLG